MVAIARSFGAFVFLMLPGMFKSTFDKEFLTTAFVCDIAADSTPDNQGSMEAIRCDVPISRKAAKVSDPKPRYALLSQM